MIALVLTLFDLACSWPSNLTGEEEEEEAEEEEKGESRADENASICREAVEADAEITVDAELELEQEETDK